MSMCLPSAHFREAGRWVAPVASLLGAGSHRKGRSRTISNTKVVPVDTLAILVLLEELAVELAASFAQALKQHRKALDLTQRQLAHRVGCAPVTIQRIEQGTLRASRQVVQRLVDIFDLPAAERERFVRLARIDSAADVTGPQTHVGDPAAVPLLRSPLPVPLTPLIGRADEVAAVCEALEGTTVRLLTLTGPGGIGKTRLALQVAADLQDDFADGAVFVDLAPIREPDLVPTTIAQALGLPAAGGQPLIARMQAALRERQLLLVLDNFEQVAAAAPVIAELLAAAAGLKVLVTSRGMVGVYGEHLVEVAPLRYPDSEHLPPLEQLVEYEAIRLFTERARAMNAGFAVEEDNAVAVAAICHRLEGLPLAIELSSPRSYCCRGCTRRVPGVFRCWREERGRCPHASERCARPSTGVTTFSKRVNRCCSGGSASL